MKKGLLLIISIVFFVFNICPGQSVELVKNLEDNFLIYDFNTKKFVPLLPHHHSNVVYFSLSSEESKNRILYIESETAFSMFLGGKFFNSYFAGITSIPGSAFGKNTGRNIFVAIKMHDNTSVSLLKAGLYKPLIFPLFASSHSADSKSLFMGTFEELKQKTVLAKDRYIIGVLLSLCIFMIIKISFPVFFTTIFSINKSQQPINDRNTLKINYFQNETFFIIVLTSVLIGVYLYVFSGKVYVIKKLYFMEHLQGFGVFIMGFIITLGLFFAKIMINLIAATVFNTGNFAKILANEFSKTVLQVLLVLYPVYFLILSPFNTFNIVNYIYVIYPIGALVIIFILKELYYFYELFNFGKFYIIAYICICDLFPTLVLIKVLTQLEFT